MSAHSAYTTFTAHHEQRRRLQRWLAILLSFAVVVSGGLLSGFSAPPARAAVHSIFPADVNGMPKDIFRADEALYVTLVSDTNGGHVCVVDAGVTDPSLANCKSPRWGSPNYYIGIGTMLGLPLEAPLLPPGTWRLLAAQSNGTVGTEVSEPFTVRPCAGVCNTAPAEAELQPWKERAGSMSTGAATMCGAAEVKIISDAVTSGISAARGMYALAGGGLAGMMLGQAAGAGWGLLNYDYALTSEAMAIAVFKNLSCGVHTMFADIAEDPPDPNFGTVAEPEFIVLPEVGDALLEEYLTAYMRAEAFGVASRIAFERYQGAVAAGDDTAAAMQAEATSRFTFDLVGELRAIEMLQPSVQALPWMDGPVTTAEDLVQAAAVRARIHSEGHTPEELAQLQALGFSEAGIAQMVADYGEIDVSTVDPDTSMRELMARVTEMLPDTITDYDRFGRSLAVAAEEIRKDIPPTEPNRAPESSFTATPETGTAPLTVEFRSTATDADGDPLTLTWDIAGIRSVSDEPVVTHTFDTPGNYGVSLVASDGELWDQAITWIEVLPAGGPGTEGSPPVANFTPLRVDAEGPLTQTFTAMSTDADGDALTHTWYFGDGQVMHGDEVTRTFEPGFITSVLLIVSDGTFTSQIAGEVTSRRPGIPPENTPPVPSFTATPSDGTAPLDVAFTATSTDADGDVLTHTWHFGDGESARGDTVSHRYDTPGTYTVTLIADDGLSSKTTTQTVSVRARETNAFTAGFTASTGYDLAKLSAGARLVSAPSSWNETSWGAHNILNTSTGRWSSAAGQNTEQEFIVELANDGREAFDELRLTSLNSTVAPKSFSVEVSTDPTPGGSYTTLIDHGELAQTDATQTFTFAPQNARFLKLTLHESYGAQTLELRELSVLVSPREGGLVLAAEGGSTIAEASTTFPGYRAVDAITHATNTHWVSERNATHDQYLTVNLRDGAAQTIDRVSVRSHQYRPKNVEVWVSSTGLAPADFTKIAARELTDSSEDHWFVFDAIDARYVQVRILDSYDAQYVGITNLKAFSPDQGSSTVPFRDRSTAGEHSLTSWRWDFGHGGQTSVERNPTHTFPGPGTYRVSLTVTDASGAERTVARDYTVLDAPGVNIRPVDSSATPLEGTNYALVAESPSGILEWEWDLGYASATPPTTANVTARFPDQGTYTVRARGLGANGIWTETATRSVTVENVAPTVEAGQDRTVFTLDTVELVGSVSDPADQVNCVLDWGDGSSPAPTDCGRGTTRASHAYELPGTYTVTLTADDGDGGVTSDTATITVIFRPSFIQVSETARQPGGLDVSFFVRDGTSGAPLPHAPATISVLGGIEQQVVSDENGLATALLPAVANDARLSVAFPGSATHESATLTRPVFAPAVDLVFIVDESGSMSSYQEAVRAHVRNLTQGLGAHLDYRVGLVGFAGGYTGGRGHVLSPFTGDVESFVTALDALRLSSASANGYDGIVTASSDDMGFRNAAASCAVLVTDAGIGEASALPATYDEALAALTARQTTLFSFILNNDPPTSNAYGIGPGLAGVTGGSAWHISDMRPNNDAALTALVDGCVTAALVPDLSVTSSADISEATPGETVEYTLTAQNTAAVHLTGVRIVDELPADAVFLSASHGGELSADGRTVSWPTFALDAGEIEQRTIRVRMPSHLPIGEHTLTNIVTIHDDGKNGDEATLANNRSEHRITLRVPERHDVGVTKTHDLPEGAALETGDRFTFTFTVTNHGTAPTTELRLLDAVPERFAVVGLDAPGWSNPAGSALVGAHPDGTTPGSWLHLVGGELGIGDTRTVTLTLEVRPFTQPEVIVDEGPLIGGVQPQVAAPPSAAGSSACVSATRDDREENDCAAASVQLKDIAVQVVVRLSGGITHLMFVARATEALAGVPVSFSWAPLRDGVPVNATPDRVTLDAVPQGEVTIVPWPGGTYSPIGGATDWPGWRPIVESDWNADGELVHPVTGAPLRDAEMDELVRGALLLDESEANHPWRFASEVTFTANPAASFTVHYREAVPGGTIPSPPTRPDPTPQPEPEPQPGGGEPQPSPAPETRRDIDIVARPVSEELVASGSDRDDAGLWLAAALLALGIVAAVHGRRGRIVRRGRA